MTYNIISTGSCGNAVIINDCILIDCGVPFKYLEPYVSDLQLVLLTHIHGDHFNKSTIRRLARIRPTLRFGCGKWLINDLIECGVKKFNIDIYTPNTVNDYRFFKIENFLLKHNVQNCGYKIAIGGEKIMYATDTNSLDGIQAKDFDLYLLEANYTDEEIHERIKEKQLNGEYAYEYQVLNNHLSKAKCDRFLEENAGLNSRFIYMHGHAGIEYD